MHKNLNAGAVAAAVLAFTSLVAGAADAPAPAAKDKPVATAKDKPVGGDRAAREAYEKSLYDKREAEAKASAKADNAKQLTGAEQKALSTKARDEYEQSVREKKDAAVAADKAARADKADKAGPLTGLTDAERKAALAAKAREEHEQSLREKSGKGETKADAKGDMKAAAKARGEKIERAPVVDPATRAAEESGVRKNPAEAAEPPKKPK